MIKELTSTANNSTTLSAFELTNPGEAAKLSKILKLAVGGTRGEAEAALNKALELAVKYNLDLSMLSPEQINATSTLKVADPIITREIRVAKGDYRRPPCFKYVNRLLNHHFNVYTIYSGDPAEASILTVVGKQSDVTRAEYVMFFLIGAFNRLWRAHALETGDPTCDRDDYWQGLWSGFHGKLNRALSDAKEKAWAEAASEEDRREYERRYALTTKSLKDQLEEAAAESVGKIVTVKARSKPMRNWEAYESGQTDGEALEIREGLTQKSSGGLKQGGNIK